ncbi:MAG TPA: hypothetical protein VHD85_18650 [Terracidiphilus sp.]|nr:hypothetical protein [Terracidiphilus sp.]
MNFPIDPLKHPDEYTPLSFEANDRAMRWFNRYRELTGAKPPDYFTFPPLVSWLRNRAIEHHSLLRGNADAAFLISFLLVDHLQSWAASFSKRICLSQIYGPRDASSAKNRQELLSVQYALERNISTVAHIFDPGIARSAYDNLYAKQPEGVAEFVYRLTRRWHLETAALKFGLVGGFDAVSEVLGENQTADTKRFFVSSLMACNSHRVYSFPRNIQAGLVTVRQIGSAESKLKDFPRFGYEVFWTHPRFDAFVQGLCRHVTDRGFFKNSAEGAA